MSTTRTHFTFRVDTWTPESMLEHVAGVEDYQVTPCRKVIGVPGQRWLHLLNCVHMITRRSRHPYMAQAGPVFISKRASALAGPIVAKIRKMVRQMIAIAIRLTLLRPERGTLLAR